MYFDAKKGSKKKSLNTFSLAADLLTHFNVYNTHELILHMTGTLKTYIPVYSKIID